MNVCNFIGGIGRDAEVRFLPNGTAVAQWSLAITSGFGDKQITTWVNCNYFGERAEKVSGYIKKGSRIGVTGELSNRAYTTKDGVEKSSLELRVNDITLLGNKDSAQGKGGGKSSQADEAEDLDIPF